MRFAVKSRPVAEDPSLQDDGGELADLRVGVAARVREERGDDVGVARDVAKGRLGAASHVVVRRQQRLEDLGEVFDGGAGLCLVRRLRANHAAHRERGVVRVCAGSREGSGRVTGYAEATRLRHCPVGGPIEK